LASDAIESLALAVLRPSAGSAAMSWLDVESALDDDRGAKGDFYERFDRI
jgi:hypothetical protein